MHNHSHSSQRSRQSRRWGRLALLIVLALLFIAVTVQPSFAALGWVGNMWPTGGSFNTVNVGDPFDVYIQVWKGGVTDGPGQGANIVCTLHWGQVENWGDPWTNVTDTPMVYHTDIGNNDEYRGTLTPGPGMYEYTANCTDTTDGQTTWQQNGNGHLTVVSSGGHDCNILWNDVLHDTFNADYRSTVGPTTPGDVITLRLRVAQDDLTSARVRVWDDRLNAETYYDMVWDGGFDDDPLTYDWWVTDVPVGGSPTILYYFFELNDNGDGMCAPADQDFYVDDDPKFYGGGYGAMLDAYNDSRSYQITVYDPNFTVPAWMQQAIVYQIFPDRFRDGDAGNNNGIGEFSYNSPTGTIYRSGLDPDQAWNTAVCDPRQLGTDCTAKYGDNFYGGDLQGILDKLNEGYFTDLGVTVLYLNPIFEAPSNHKYDTANYQVIDDNFGDLATFQALAAAAEAQGIYLLLDGVFNHTSSDSSYFDRYSRYDVNGNLTSPNGPGVNDGSGACESVNSPYRSWFYFPDIGNPGTDNGVPVLCDGGLTYEAWFGYSSLPKLQANSPAVRDLIWANDLQSVAPYWTSQGAAGWRFDVGNEIDPGLTHDPNNDYWEGFRAAVRDSGVTGRDDTLMLGEVWEDASALLLGNEWDSVMNYRFRSAMLSWLFTGCSGNGCASDGNGQYFMDNDSNPGSSSGEIRYISPSQFNARLLSIWEDYPPMAWKAMMNLDGSHDTNRMRFLLKKVNNDNDSAAIQRMKEWWLFAFTYAGAPTIYYGDEIGLSHDGVWDGMRWEDDPYNRAPYPWSDTPGDYIGDTNLLGFVQNLAAIRNANPVLQDGDVQHGLVIDDANQLYGFGRTNGSDVALIALNRSGAAHDVTFSGLNDAPYNLADGVELVDVLNGGVYTVVGGQATVPVNPTWGVILLADTTPPDNDSLYVSLAEDATVGGVVSSSSDILHHNNTTDTWSMYFDGSDVGAAVDLDAFAFAGAGAILMSFAEPTTLPGIGAVDDSDIVRFTATALGDNTAGTFQFYFDGSDVGLTTDDEDVDAILPLSQGRLMLSTGGAFTVNSGAITGTAADLLLFIPTQLGPNTAGSWTFAFDGSDVGLDTADENVEGVTFYGGQLHLTTSGEFAVTGSSGDGSDIFRCQPAAFGQNTNCVFTPGLYWDGSVRGLAGRVVDGFAILSGANAAPVVQGTGRTVLFK
ncbi:MAG: hypothetical protein Fur0021_27410 [Candidatus Promineifilaceae bacterium]